MAIIVSGHTKGGTGKSTIATSMAAKVIQDGMTAMVIELDETGTSSSWHAIREANGYQPSVPVVQQLKSYLPVILDLSGKYDALIVDVGARDPESLTPLAKICDLWVAPVGVGQPDLTPTISLYDEFSSKHEHHKHGRIPLVMLFNKMPAAWNSAEELEAREYLAEQCPDLVVLKSSLKERKAWRDAGRLGLGITEMSHREGGKAAEEFTNFMLEAISYQSKIGAK